MNYSLYSPFSQDLAYQRQVLDKAEEFVSEVKTRRRRTTQTTPGVYIPNELYWYAITLTNRQNYDKTLNSIYRSKMFKIIDMCVGRELNPSGDGGCHVHILVKSQKFIDAKEIYVKNKKNRVDVKLLRTILDIRKWHNYIHKENHYLPEIYTCAQIP